MAGDRRVCVTLHVARVDRESPMTPVSSRSTSQTSQSDFAHPTTPPYTSAFGTRLALPACDRFEATHLEPKVDVCNRLYVFDAHPPEFAECSIITFSDC